MAIEVEIPLYHLIGMELQPFKVIYATSTAINCCALRSPSISFLWGCRKLFANNTGIVIIQVWFMYWGTKYTCTTMCNDFVMLSLIGNEETDARVHVLAIYCGHIQKHAVILPPYYTWQNHIRCNTKVTWQLGFNFRNWISVAFFKLFFTLRVKCSLSLTFEFVNKIL